MIRKFSVGLLTFLITLTIFTITSASEVKAYDAQCPGYWVGMVNSDSSVTKISCVDSYDGGVTLMNQQTSSASSVASVFNADTIVASKYATLDFTSVGSVSKNSYANAVYKDGSIASKSDYFNGYYGSEGVYLITGSSPDNAITYISGLKSTVNKSRGGLTQYNIIPISVSAPQNVYVRTDNGSLKHYFRTSSGQSSLTIGVAPDYIVSGKTYYSADGHYFYENYLTMIDDLNQGIFDHAINNVPWYNYYQFLPFHSATNYTAADIDNYLKGMNITNLAYTYYSKSYANEGGLGLGVFPKEGESILYGAGSYLIQAAQEYGINPLLLLSISINETGWGRSFISIVKQNLFGMGAYDSSTDSAKNYDSVISSAKDMAKLLSYNYLDCANDRYYYNGAYLGNKQGGVNVKYASDPYWGEKAAAHYYQFDQANGYKDYNSYVIGVTNSAKVRAYNNPGDTKFPYYYGGVTHDLEGSAVLITGESGDYYTVMADVSPEVAYDWSNNGFTSTYDFENNIRYVKKSDITITNPSVAYTTPKNNLTNNLIRVEYLSEYYPLKTNQSLTVYTDAYLSTSKNVTLASGVYLTAKERAYTNSADYSYKIIYDLSTGNTGWILASQVTELTASYAIKYQAAHDALPSYIYSSMDTSSSIVGKVTYNNEAITIIDTITSGDTVWYKVSADLVYGTIGYTLASGFHNAIAHTGPTPSVPEVPGDLPNISDLIYKENIYDLDSLKLNTDGTSVKIRGLLAIEGINNSASENFAYELVLTDENTNQNYTIALQRWTDSSEYPYDINAIPNNSYDYSGAWFQGDLDFNNIPNGNYQVTLIAKNATYYTTQGLTNTYSKNIAQRFTNSAGTGIEFRTNFLLKKMPLEVFIRTQGLITTETKPTIDNAFIEYSKLSLNAGLLDIKGSAYNVNGDYSASGSVSRTIIFENTSTYERTSYDVGSITTGDYAIVLRVNDGYDKTRAWYHASLDLTKLGPGTYNIYVKTTSANGLSDYGELTDVFCRSLPEPVTYNGKTYTLKLVTNQRYQITLTVE